MERPGATQAALRGATAEEGPRGARRRPRAALRPTRGDRARIRPAIRRGGARTFRSILRPCGSARRNADRNVRVLRRKSRSACRSPPSRAEGKAAGRRPSRAGSKDIRSRGSGPTPRAPAGRPPPPRPRPELQDRTVPRTSRPFRARPCRSRPLRTPTPGTAGTPPSRPIPTATNAPPGARRAPGGGRVLRDWVSREAGVCIDPPDEARKINQQVLIKMLIIGGGFREKPPERKTYPQPVQCF